MVEINPISVVPHDTALKIENNGDVAEAKSQALGAEKNGPMPSENPTAEGLQEVATEVERVVTEVTQARSLSFSVEEDLSRLVVAVRVVGSDEIIRQFPPEEFISVAKFIAAQDPEMIDEDYLKGILFDQYT